MKTMLEETWTIREAVERVFSHDEHRIPVSTIQTWMQRAVFVPNEPAERRDPRGAILNLADVVTLSVLGLLLNVGVNFRDFLASGWSTCADSEPITRLGLRQEAHDILFYVGAWKQGDMNAVAQEIELRRRPIQVFLEILDYQCAILVVTPTKKDETKTIWFSRMDENILDPWVHLDSGGNKPPVAVTAIDVRRHHAYVQRRLGG